MFLRCVIYLTIIFLAACTSSKTTPNDNDPCVGRCGVVDGVACGHCDYGYSCNTAQFCIEIPGNDIDVAEPPDDGLMSPDADNTGANGDVDQAPDIDELCPDLKVYENVKAAGFPLKDTNGKITFCRPGCDMSTDNDPQCMKNLWDWVNWGRYQEYKKGTANYKECYPWPCEMPDMKAETVFYSECDKKLSNNYFQGNAEELYDLAISNSVVGIFMCATEYDNEHPPFRIMEYSPSTDRFTSILYGAHAASYRYGRYFFHTSDGDLMENFDRTYIATAQKTASGFKTEVIYDDEQHQAWFSRPPLVGDKWVVLNIEHRSNNTLEVKYAKMDEWIWHDLNRHKVYEGSVAGDHLTFIDTYLNIYVCDLTKLPYNPETDCMRIDRDDESVNDPRLNEENPNELVYHDLNKMVMIHVDISSGIPVYSELPYTMTETISYGAYPDQFKGNIVLYSEIFYNETAGKDIKACFYRLDTKKQYCPTKVTDPRVGRYYMVYNSFDDKYLLWKTPLAPLAYIRDLACYCEKEGVCPFE